MLTRRLLGALIVVAPLAALSTSCSSSVNVKQAVEVIETGGGWYDAGIVEGKNKIVPMVSFRLQKKGEADLDSISLNVAFRELPPPGGNTEKQWADEEVFLQNVKFEGAQTSLLTVRTKTGYTGDPPQSRLELLKNSHFRDKRAHLFAKASGGQWVELATIDVPRQLITR